MWKAYDSNSCLRETSGLRGVAPSVRFFENIPTLSASVEVFHVPSSEDLYFWGVEMFSGGIDCVSISYIPLSGIPILIKDGGKSVSHLFNKKRIDYLVGSISVTESLPFDDFWNEPYLVKKNEEVVVKSNFFRSFILLLTPLSIKTRFTESLILLFKFICKGLVVIKFLLIMSIN